MPSAPQPSCVRATSPHHRKLGAGYVALPQMTGRRFGKPFILSPPTLALSIPTKQRVMVKFFWKDFKPFFSFLWFFDEGFYNQ